MSFGSKLSEIRIKCGVSQEELAEKLDVSAQTVHRWEHDKSAPNIHQLKTLCEVFNVTSSYFFEEAEQNEPVIAEETEACAETAIAEETVAEEAPLEMPAQGRAEKTPQSAMLFANKWYYWICLVPWFIMFAQSLHEKTGLLFCIGSCIVWSVFTLSQELLFRLKTAKEEGIQCVLNIVKTLAIMAIALYSMFKNEQLIWKILFIFVCCMSTIICIWEIILIKYEYKNRRN